MPISSTDPYQYSSSLVLHYVEAECEISTTKFTISCLLIAYEEKLPKGYR